MPFVRVLLLILIVSAAAGCGGGCTASSNSDVAGAKKAVRTCVAGSIRTVGTAQRSYAAVVQERAQAFRKPGSARLASFGPQNVNGVPTVFAVLAKRVDRACCGAAGTACSCR